MFLHSGAGLHGHEYSSRSSTPATAAAAASSPPVSNLRYPLSRSTLVPAKTRTNIDGRTAPPVLRQRPVSEYIPRKVSTPEPIVRFQEIEEEEGSSSGMHEDGLLSESELSEATAFSLDTTATKRGGMRRRRRPSHKSTRYFLGYPTPSRFNKTRVIKKVLPRLLLQLQKVSEDGRSRPVLEVFPASKVAGPVIAPRLAKRFPGILGVKRHLGFDDIVLVKRDDDESLSETESESDEGLERKRLLAVYSPLKHSDEAEIVLEDGSVWVAKPRANGSYDFLHVDEHGVPTTVRWARRSTGTPTADTIPTEAPSSTASSPANPSQTRFTFSIINPLTRRHPVMATLTQSTLEIQDTYTPVSSSYGQYPPHRNGGRTLSLTASSPASWGAKAPVSPSKRTSTGSTTDGESEDGIIALPSVSEIDSRRAAHPIDDSVKMLISVTALWVTLRSGWSAGRSNSDLLSSPSTSTRSSRRHTWSRTNSDTCGRATPQPSEPEVFAQPTKRHSMPLPSTDKPKVSSPPRSRAATPVSGSKDGPRHATSTGAAYAQRRTERSEANEKEERKKTRTSFPKSASQNPSSATVARIASSTTARRGSLGETLPSARGVEPKEMLAGKKGVRSRLSRWIHKMGSR
ncbi:hypothetical protein QBC34DRAFT_174372 [Podospora aff. communis PSN243]|uniref:Uncharacterized protein n=1 Tax=Podospora aff. communis PSN243 TaxID=3040156 RepID=A0AAV9GZ27_9PEZI|nr:hypothetical protein QBC34DRAFT_174372 [Podospora aff. communis PSN243]